MDQYNSVDSHLNCYIMVSGSQLLALWDLNLFKTMVIALIHCRNIIGSSSKSQSMKKDTATKRDTISSFDCLKPETKLVAVTFFFFTTIMSYLDITSVSMKSICNLKYYHAL